MPYLLDANIAIHALEGMEAIMDKIAENDGNIVLSALTLAELKRGVYKNAVASALLEARLAVLLRDIPVLPFDQPAAKVYGKIIAQCGWVRGRDFDRMIAAHAISSKSVLVTNNTRDFTDIPGLKLDNWVVRS